MAYVNSDLGFIGTKPSNFYAKLNSYNQDSVFGPPVPPIVPSMQYITLPQEHVNYGYDALTHHGDGNNYYSVTTGYGNKCTTFNTAKCPTNQIIGGAGAVPAPAPAPEVREGFCHPQQKRNKTSDLKTKIKNLNLLIYVDTQNCGHCQNMKKLLRQNDLLDVVELKEITIPCNRQELLSLGGQGVPFILSRNLGTSVTGVPPNLEGLVVMLRQQKKPQESKIPPHLEKKLKDLKLVIYVSDMCSHCKMYKQFINENGIRHLFKIVNVANKDETDNDAFLQTNSLVGYPTTYSCKLKTSFPGVPKDVEQLIALLSNQT
jgi:glutaredoxin